MRKFLGVALVVASLLTFSCGRPSEEKTSAPAPSQQSPELAALPPMIGPVSPASGSGRSATFRITVSHQGGAPLITDIQFLVNQVLPGPGQTACWIDINAGKTVAARNEEGSAFLPAVEIGSPKSVANSKCSVDASGVKWERLGNEVVATLPVTFAASFKGPKKIWVIASSPKNFSGWQERGTWLVE